MAIIHEQQNIPVAVEKHADEHQRGARQPIPLDRLGVPVENDDTTLHASTTQHGLLKKLSGYASDMLRGDGTWGDPSTATPTASAIPKADSSGKLVDWVRTKWTAQTTDGTQTEAFVNGVSNSRLTIPNNSAMRVNFAIIAKTPGAANISVRECWAWAYNDGGTVSVSTPAWVFSESVGTVTGWSFALSVNQTDKSVRPLVTGAAGQTIKWAITSIIASVAD